jgi:cell fate regulator YaaT (PSP1 superfamily)
VVVRTARGLELGVVRSRPVEVPRSGIEGTLKPVERKATEDDIERAEQTWEREREALATAEQKVAEHGLPMKLIEAECTLDGNRIVIHFTAEGRVDFRALVRDLARALHARIELHQVGVRDEAKLLGGMGHCGRPLCCATFLTEFDPVGIKTAKDQDLSLNPQKISGVCGRLMCCLNYEYAHYRDAKQCMPRVGSRLQTELGPGKITEINSLRGRVVVTLDEGGKVQLPAEAVLQHKAGCPHQRSRDGRGEGSAREGSAGEGSEESGGARKES